MGIVDLYFIALLRPAAVLVHGMKIDTGVGTRGCHYFGLEFKVFKIMMVHLALIK